MLKEWHRPGLVTRLGKEICIGAGCGQRQVRGLASLLVLLLRKPGVRKAQHSRSYRCRGKLPFAARMEALQEFGDSVLRCAPTDKLYRMPESRYADTG